MSQQPEATPRKRGGVRTIGIITVIAGIVLAVAGGATYFLVRSQLADQKITVSSDADHFAGDKVDSPWTAYVQAQTINKHASEASGGKTYAELPQDDPNRQTVMTASFLQASLYTSVVAFGVGAMAFGLGIVLLLVGIALVRLASTYVLVPAVAVDGDFAGSGSGRHAVVPEPVVEPPVVTEPVVEPPVVTDPVAERPVVEPPNQGQAPGTV